MSLREASGSSFGAAPTRASSGPFLGAIVFVLLQTFAIDVIDRERFNLVIGGVFFAIVFVWRRSYTSGLARHELQITERHARRVQAMLDTALRTVLLATDRGDPAVFDQDVAMRIEAGGGVDDAGSADDQAVSHDATFDAPRRWFVRVMSHRTAIRTATPFVTCSSTRDCRP